VEASGTDSQWGKEIAEIPFREIEGKIADECGIRGFSGKREFLSWGSHGTTIGFLGG
jgi:hypothetical protein